jgi:hypothetical protein
VIQRARVHESSHTPTPMKSKDLGGGAYSNIHSTDQLVRGREPSVDSSSEKGNLVYQVRIERRFHSVAIQTRENESITFHWKINGVVR